MTLLRGFSPRQQLVLSSTQHKHRWLSVSESAAVSALRQAAAGIPLSKAFRICENHLMVEDDGDGDPDERDTPQKTKQKAIERFAVESARKLMN